MTEYDKSVVSGAKLVKLFSVGELYVSDFLKEGEKPKGPPCEMALGFDPVSKAVQLTKQPDASLMWGSMYYYRSAVNPAMREALADLAKKTSKSIPEKNKKTVYLDIASNDGYLLSTVDSNRYIRVGIDPSDYPEAKDNTDVNIQEYFSAKAFTKAGYTKASRISCAACFYDVDKPEQFLKGLMLGKVITVPVYSRGPNNSQRNFIDPAIELRQFISLFFSQCVNRIKRRTFV